MGDASKIHVGAGNLTLNPDSSPIDLGFCSDGAILKYSAALEAITIDQVLAPVGYFVPGEECQFETIVSQASADKLKYVQGYGTVTTVAADADNKGYSKIEFGGNTVLTDYVLEYAAPKRSNRNLYIRIRLLKVNISPELEIAFLKDGKTGFKFVAKAVADTTQDVGKQLGYYMEETADLTGTTPTLAVSSTVPADGGTNIAIAATIAVTFNRSIHPESVNEGNFVLLKADGSEAAGTVAQTSANVATFTPTASMANSTVYLFVISENVRALDDYTKMANNVYVNFTTIAP